MTVEVDPALSVDEKASASWAGPGTGLGLGLGDGVATAVDRPLAERLRRLTRDAPLQALAVAFLLGMFLARRRRS